MHTEYVVLVVLGLHLALVQLSPPPSLLEQKCLLYATALEIGKFFLEIALSQKSVCTF